MPGLHVPAWKRLGLQLKRPAAVDETSSSNSIDVSTITKKRKLNEDNGSHVKKTVSGRTSDSSPITKEERNIPTQLPALGSVNSSTGRGENTKRVGGDKTESSTALETETPNLEPSTTPKLSPAKSKKRKSVQFTPDVRQVDGPEHPLDYSEVNSDTSKDSKPASPSSSTPTELPTNKKKKQKKTTASQESQDPSTLPSEEASPTEATRAYLAYLTTYHEDRPNWKFNKNNQTQILQNIFNLYRIPSPYDPAISSYLQGLQGQAARIRLRDSAHKLLDEEEEESPSQTETQAQATAKENTTNDTMNHTTLRAAAKTSALKTDIHRTKRALAEEEQTALEATPTWQHKLQKRRRAQTVLDALADSEYMMLRLPATPAPSMGERPMAGPKKIVFGEETGGVAGAGASTGAQKQGQAQGQARDKKKRSRGRKRRTLTGVPDDDSSSSDSDSDSSPAAKPKTPATTAATTATTTTAEEESDSDSDEDSSSSSEESDSDSDSSSSSEAE